MQIFIPYPDYRKSAMALDDHRPNKQIIELGQILSTAIWIEDSGVACCRLPIKEITVEQIKRVFGCIEKEQQKPTKEKLA